MVGLKQGIHIQGAITGGFKGQPKLFLDICFQLCQFHQQQTVRCYLTRNSKSEAGNDLKALTNSLFRLFQDRLCPKQLQEWHSRCRYYLSEQSCNE